ncbi:MAG: AAA family ATPase [Candidatus Moeniiplasma glomeromycotorum]|nr:AAA family ATPase [Candidatus Moeniiplasma glomeromycotorum]MCE8167387.1 AAA family ATPase [Candidatus Moeniiplasma glomeromycotorum]MCE8168600.1 AAA family ATPase [Candidatus Moeniiplasma glomeromycotorum]
MTIIEELENKKTELEERHAGHSSWGSRQKEILEHKIRTLDKLISAYQSTSPSVSQSEIETVFNQQIGFEELKRKILDHSKIILVVGPTGCGKTASARWLAQALKRELFIINLAGLSDPSVLVGASESSSGSEIGQLAKALVETQTHTPLILLDEFDKVRPSIQDSLLAILDPIQNQAVLDYYLDVKLDFSQAIFIITANNLNKIPDYFRSRLSPVELTGYTLDQKKEIIQQIIQEFFADKESLKNNFEITSGALETLINKTKEKGVRQLKQACDKVFTYFLSQWTEMESSGTIEKITLTPSSVNQIIPDSYFANVDQEDNQPDQKEQISQLQKEITRLQRENKTSSQTKIKAAQLRSLNLVQQKLNHTGLKKENLGELNNYEERINQTKTVEETEVIREMVLLQIEYQNTLRKPPTPSQDKPSKLDNWAEIERLSKILEEKWRNFQPPSNPEIEKLKKELQDLQKSSEESTWNIKNNAWFILFIISLASGAIYTIFKFIRTFSNKKKRESKKTRTQH